MRRSNKVFILALYAFLALFASSALAQNTVTVTASQIHNGTPTGLLPAGTILFQAVNAQGQNISYQVGAAGPSLTAPTVCAVTNGAITGTCTLPNVLVSSPQNFFFAVTVKNTSNVVVLGGPGTAYNDLQPVPNSSWCTAAVCNFDLFFPTIPNAVYTLFLPPPKPNSLGGIYSESCAGGKAVIGYDIYGHEICAAFAGAGGTWGTITGTLANQTDLYTYLLTLAPLNSPSLTGVPSVPTPLLMDNSTTIPNTSWINSKGYAPLLSPNFTGIPTAPTPLTADSSTKIATTAWVNAQGYSSGSGNVSGPGSSVVNDVVLFGGTNGQAIIDAGFGFPLASAHIGTLSAGSNGLVASATTDTTNAANISSGTLPAARLPNPSSTTFGGVKSYASVSHQWLNSLTTTGLFTSTQPACGDLSNGAPSCSVDTTNASNITSGTLPSAQLPNPLFPSTELLLETGTKPAPAIGFAAAPGLGLYLATVPATWSVTASSGNGTTATVTISNTAGWPFTFIVGEYLTIAGDGAYNCSFCAITAVNSVSSTVSYASAATGVGASGTFNLDTLALSGAAHKVLFNSLQSTSSNAAQSGSIQLGPSDAVTSYDVADAYTATLLQKNVNVSAGPLQAAQLGDPTYGAVTAAGAPLIVNGNLTVTGVPTMPAGLILTNAGVTVAAMQYASSRLQLSNTGSAPFSNIMVASDLGPFPQCNPLTGTFFNWDTTGSQAGNLNNPNPGWYCVSGIPYVALSPTVALPNSITPVGATVPAFTATMPVGSTANLFGFNCAASSNCLYADSLGNLHANSFQASGSSTAPCGALPGSPPASGLLFGCNSATGQFFTETTAGVVSELPPGGVKVYTSNQTASLADNGALVVMNCGSACAYTLPGTQPSAKWSAFVMTVGTTNATIALGGGDTFNGSASVPVLNQYRIMHVNADTTTATNYYGEAPLVAGTNMAFAPASNGLTITASNSGVVSTVYDTASAATNANITATTMITSLAASTLYQISFYVFQSAAGTSCTTNTSVTPNVLYTDPNSGSSKTQGLAPFAIVNNGTANTSATMSSGVSSFTFSQKASTAIQYTMTYVAGTGCSPAPTVTVQPVLIQLKSPE